MQQTQNEKVSNFVTHLLSNPNIKSEPILIAEGIVLNFIVTNLEKLKVTFKSPQFFPELETKQVLALLINDLKNRALSEVMPKIFSYIDLIDFSVLEKYSSNQNSYSNEYYQKVFKKYLQEILTNKDVRLHFNAVYNILKLDVFERYVGVSFLRRSPTYFELVRVQKNNLRTEEYVNYLKILLLLRASAYHKVEIPGLAANKVCINNYIKDVKTLPLYFKQMAGLTSQKLPGVHTDVIEMALKSNVPEAMIGAEDSSARFLYIMSHRFQTYQEYNKIERGAETPDKSWFGIMRKNAAHYGFDKRVLEDLYMISGDNKW